jgi:glycosyltransferase involved in cell wall biosynthesis
MMVRRMGGPVRLLKLLAGRHAGIVRFECIRNGGPGLAREHGRRLARGEFIQYLDSDDVLLPCKFSNQVAALRAGNGGGRRLRYYTVS